MSRTRQLPRRAGVLTVAALTVALSWGNRTVSGDDIDLLRFNTAKPYVFFILDTSASMTLSPSGQWVHANGDDPRSKLYQAKRVLYEVFEEVDDIHFGFAGMNQDKGGVVAKHWLYYNTAALPGGWPIAWPRPDVDGPVQTAADGSAISDVEGDILTFGPHLNATGEAGSCAAPLTLGTQTEKINRFAKLGALGSSATKIWLRANNKTYLLTVTRPGNKPDTSLNPKLGEDNMNVRLALDEIRTCPGTIQQTFTANLDLKLWTDFIMADEDVNSTTPPGGSHNSGLDRVAGFWNYKGFSDLATCGSGHPFSGKGWEGNYDGASNGFPPGFPGLKPTEDPFCNPASPASCYNLKRTTQFDPLGRAMDRGDVLPLDWRVENKDAFLERLAPSHDTGVPDFRIATYFKDQAEAATGALSLKNPSRIPLLGSGPTPLGKSVIDFRCWYLGEGNKCNDAAYNPGWEDIAQSRDSEWGCRRPYLIVISDGNDSCGGENPCADTASLNSQAGVRTWVIAYGADCAKTGNPLKCMAQNGKGELLCPQTANDLKSELLKILGLIREEARAFASAAVPSVQAIADQTIYLTNFTPLNGRSVWDGHVHSFLKPIPLTDDGRPDITDPNHLWDAGEVVRDEQVNPGDFLGPNPNQRRVFYARQTPSGNLVAGRRYLEQPTGTTPEDSAIRHDLWRGMEIPFTPGEAFSEGVAAFRTANVINRTFSIKSHTQTVTDPITGNPTVQTIRYVLGDIFHSNPIVIGSPPNTLYFSADVPGYRDFFRKHELRRKMLLVGSNDGMLHAFNAGQYDPSEERFDNGTGHEVFAYIPRPVLPTIRSLTESSLHQWGVDGTVTIADVFVDPLQQGTPDPDRREWRTVVFGGLREGGSGYYALDVTQPDRLVEDGEAFVPQPGPGGVPSCLGTEDGQATGGCGPVPFPAPLWEFTDSVRNASGALVKLDEDNNRKPDLGETWSIPNVGRIRMTEGGEVVDKYVLVAGGGFDPEGSKTAPERGTWLYIIDVETGKAIYKRQLVGAAPSEPAAVDTNQDGYLDRIYIGTTLGQMYRVDLTAAAAGGSFPELTAKLVRGMDGNTYTVRRVPDTAWVPRIVFNANTDNGVPTASPRPIYYRPSVLFVTRLGLYALTFGVGDREDLWNNDGQTGRFYVFVDDTEPGITLDESRFARLTVGSPSVSSEYLLQNSTGRRGWYLVLDPDERLITDPFGLSGVTFFSTFQPDVEVIGGRDPLCSKTGISRIFVVSTVNGNPFLTDVEGAQVRNMIVSQFVTNPFTEQGLTKNDFSGGGDPHDPNPPPPPPTREELCEDETMLRLKQQLQTLFPSNCKFSNQTVNIKTISAKTSLLCIAPVPVCVIEKNWKEF
ncbi:MAG TPA: PilC/PilY family type IV pilus protein [Thermoanaerobaculia bacterium]|nr:PilC/PilY family type IV pilus protein [Thermoanaerobaculia bacterium]